MSYFPNSVLSWLMKGFLILLVPFEIWEGNFFAVTIIILIIFLSFIPAIVSHNVKKQLPWTVDFMVTLALTLHTIGFVFGLYHNNNFWWWDNMTHFLGTITIGLVAFQLIFSLNFVGKVKMSLPLVGFFIFVTALAIGVLWEIFEWNSDLFFHTNYQLGPYLTDTMTDLSFDTLGAILISLFGIWYMRQRILRELDMGKWEKTKSNHHHNKIN